MEFRSDTPKRVVSEDGVHTALIGDDWRELPPILHAAAIAAGVEFRKDKGKVDKVESKPADPDALSQTGEDGVIRKALNDLLARNDDNDFTGDGHPRVDAVNKLTGMTHTKADILRVWEALADEAAQK